MAAGSIGNTLLPVAAASLAAYLTWRLGFGLLVPGFVAATLLLWWAVPRRTSSGDHAMDALSVDALRQVYREVLKKSIPIVVSVHILLAFASHGFLGFYPTYLNEVKGFSPQMAATIYALYFAAGIVVQPFIGMLRDWTGSRWSLMLITVMFLIGLISIQVADTLIHFVILTIALSHRNGTSVVTNTYIADTLPETVQGSGLGLLRTFWQLAGASSPLFVGYLGDIGELSFAYLVLAGVTSVAALLTFFIPHR
jgi:predicted MFS family arabinose efflux permease